MSQSDRYTYPRECENPNNLYRLLLLPVMKNSCCEVLLTRPIHTSDIAVNSDLCEKCALRFYPRYKNGRAYYPHLGIYPKDDIAYLRINQYDNVTKLKYAIQYSDVDVIESLQLDEQDILQYLRENQHTYYIKNGKFHLMRSDDCGRIEEWMNEKITQFKLKVEDMNR